MRNISLLYILLFSGMVSCSAGKIRVHDKNDNGRIMSSQNSKYSSGITDRYWKLIELMDKKVLPNDNHKQEAHLILQTENSMVVGNGGCNSFNGTYVLSEENRIKFSQLISTKMACLNLEIENEYFKALGSADNYTIKGDTLTLNGAGMAPLAKFVPVSPK